LQAWEEKRSETAFAELVRRHVDFVYSAAFRMVHDAHLAEDVSQAVFLALAQNARHLIDRRVLSGWLHRTTQNLAANVIRSDVRRRIREQEAASMNELLSAAPEASWENVAPELDAALGVLSEPDRDAVLLRYFERKSAQEMAQILGISDEAAQRRVNRAVERLRDYFSKRNVSVGASGLALLISANAVQSAPVGLSAAISTGTVLASTAAQSSAIVTATKVVAMTALQKTIIAATIAAVAAAGIYEVRQASHLRSQVQTLQQESPVVEQLQQLQREHDQMTNMLAEQSEELAKAKSNDVELLKLRNEVSLLRRDSQELAKLKAGNAAADDAKTADEQWLDRIRLLKERLDQTPGARIPETQFLTEDDWLWVAKYKLETDDDFKRAFSELRARAEGNFLRTAETALTRYMGSNSGVFPTELSQLKPYFKDPPADEILERYHIVPASSIPQGDLSGDGTGWLITLKTPDSGSLWTLNQRGLSGNSYDASDTMAVLAPAMKALMAATPPINGKKSVTMQMLEPYLTTPEQKAAYQKLMQQSNAASK
jgi:RNA polymerase sigma factor (sigma-70 family)